METLCPCNHQIPYQHCCGPYLARTQWPPTAEALMRSRYTAFVRGDVDYLIATSHPPQNRASLGETVQTVQWIGLEVVRTRQGQATDQRGSVEFVATYVPKGQFGPPQQMRERSEFCKRGDRWFYRTQ